VRLHDGSTILLRKVDPDYDPTRRNNALGFLERHRSRGEVVTGLLYIDQNVFDMHTQSRTVKTPLKDMKFKKLNPGSEALAELQKGMK
jgi:2-oxoglutarate ferredoxin oxidoreductase subunit beta